MTPDQRAGTADDETSAATDGLREYVEHVRQAVAAQTENTSLRDVARKIGMSPAGLKKFLEGSAPYRPTLRRLREWYVHHGAVRTATVQMEDAYAAINVLAHDLGPTARRRLATRVIDAMSHAYGEVELPPPAWLPDLRSRYQAAPAEPGERPGAPGGYARAGSSSGA